MNTPLPPYYTIKQLDHIRHSKSADVYVGMEVLLIGNIIDLKRGSEGGLIGYFQDGSGSILLMEDDGNYAPFADPWIHLNLEAVEASCAEWAFYRDEEPVILRAILRDGPRSAIPSVVVTELTWPRCADYASTLKTIRS